MKTCAVLAGSDRYRHLDDDYLEDRFHALVWDYGVKRFLCGADRGAELQAFTFLLQQRERLPGIAAIGVFADEHWADHWLDDDRETLFNAMARADGEWLMYPADSNGDILFQRDITLLKEVDLIFLLGRNESLEAWAAKLRKGVIKTDAKQSLAIPSLHLYRPTT